jgi:hypothetical protein
MGDVVHLSAKLCRCCRTEKPIGEFGRSKRWGTSIYCRACVTEKNKVQTKRRSQREKIFVSEKSCARCRVTKPIAEFRLFNQSLDGHNPTCKQCMRDSDKKRRAALTKDEKWRQHLWDTYRITFDDYEAMLVAQKHSCFICERHVSEVRLVVDHCHDTGEVRGLLCTGCNTSLGQFGDAPRALERAIAYLRRPIFRGRTCLA